MKTTNAKKGTPSPPKQPRKAPVRHVRGRMLRAIEVKPGISDGDGGWLKEPVLKSFWFELRQDGLHVRRFRQSKKRARVWPFQHLANGAGSREGQMEMFPGQRLAK